MSAPVCWQLCCSLSGAGHDSTFSGIPLKAERWNNMLLPPIPTAHTDTTPSSLLSHHNLSSHHTTHTARQCVQFVLRLSLLNKPTVPKNGTHHTVAVIKTTTRNFGILLLLLLL